MTSSSGLVPLAPQRKWRAITLATVAFAPGYWAILAGEVALASDDVENVTGPAAAICFGLATLPFVFLLLAFLSEHPNAPKATLKAMGVSLLVGLVVAGLAADGVTGIIAGVGAGGICALRFDQGQELRPRVLGVCIAAAYTFVLVRTLGAAGLLPAPAFPFTALGIADHLSERRHERIAAAAD